MEKLTTFESVGMHEPSIFPLRSESVSDASTSLESRLHAIRLILITCK
jgi:hypothetical protein